MKRIKSILLLSVIALPLGLSSCQKETISMLHINTNSGSYISNYGSTSITFIINPSYSENITWNTSLFNENAEVTSSDIFKDTKQLMGKKVKFEGLDKTNTQLTLQFYGNCDSKYAEEQQEITLDFNAGKVFQGKIGVVSASAETSFMRAGIEITGRSFTDSTSATIIGALRGVTAKSSEPMETKILFKNFADNTGKIEEFKINNTASFTLRTFPDESTGIELSNLEYEEISGSFNDPLECKVVLYNTVYGSHFKGIEETDNLQLELPFYVNNKEETYNYVWPIGTTFYFTVKEVKN